MVAQLWVLQGRYPAAPRLHGQRVQAPDWPRLHERFVCETSTGARFVTDRVEHVGPLEGREMYFATKHTAYLLERLDA